MSIVNILVSPIIIVYPILNKNFKPIFFIGDRKITFHMACTDRQLRAIVKVGYVVPQLGTCGPTECLGSELRQVPNSDTTDIRSDPPPHQHSRMLHSSPHVVSSY